MSSKNRPPLISKYTYRSHIFVKLLNALFLSVFSFRDVVARKTLLASDVEIVILTTAANGFFIFGFFISKLMEGRPKRPFILVAAYLGRGSLLLVLFITDPRYFILVCCLSFLGDMVYHPAWSSILQSNYHPDWQGRLSSKAHAYSGVVLMIAAFFVGMSLDHTPELYQVLFPIAGIIGMLGYIKAANIKIRRMKFKTSPNEITLKLFSSSFSSMVTLLKGNKYFLYYEIIFFIYGIGFMVLLPVNIFLFVDAFDMSYKEITLAQIICFQVSFAFCSPIAGKIFDHFKVIVATGVYFILLSFYPLFLFLAIVFHLKICVYISFLVFGMAMAGVVQSWLLSSVKFSGEQDSSVFMGIHISAVGVRALIGPAIGVAIATCFSMKVVFVLSFILFLLSGCLMFCLKSHVRGSHALRSSKQLLV